MRNKKYEPNYVSCAAMCGGVVDTAAKPKVYREIGGHIYHLHCLQDMAEHYLKRTMRLMEIINNEK